MSQSHPADRPEMPRRPRSATGRAIPPTPQRKHLPRYKVVLLQNGIHELMVVVFSVMELMRYPRTEATHKMWETYHCGSSVLLTTYRERAELFVEQFAERGLSVKLELIDAHG